MPGWLPEKVSSRMRWTTSAPGTTRWSSSWTSSSWIAVEQGLVRGLVLLVVGVPAQVPARLVAALVRAAVGRLGQAEGAHQAEDLGEAHLHDAGEVDEPVAQGALGVDGRDAPPHGGGAERRLHGLLLEDLLGREDPEDRALGDAGLLGDLARRRLAALPVGEPHEHLDEGVTPVLGVHRGRPALSRSRGSLNSCRHQTIMNE